MDIVPNTSPQNVHPRLQQLYQLVQADPKGAAEYIFKLENDVQQMNPQYLIKSIQDLDEQLVHTVARFSEYESASHWACCTKQACLGNNNDCHDPDVQRLGREINKTIADKGVTKASTFLDHIQKRIQAMKEKIDQTARKGEEIDENLRKEGKLLHALHLLQLYYTEVAKQQAAIAQQEEALRQAELQARQARRQLRVQRVRAETTYPGNTITNVTHNGPTVESDDDELPDVGGLQL